MEKMMFKLPSRSRFSNVDHERELKNLLTERTGDISPEERKRLDVELEYVHRFNLYPLFLLLYEITSLFREKGFLFCARKELSSSIIAYLLGISRVNPVIAGSGPETYFDNYETFIPDRDKKAFESALAQGDMDRRHFERIYGQLKNPNVFEVVESEYDDILALLREYYGGGNVAITLALGPARSIRTGYYARLSEHPAAIAFLPDNVCQSNGITLEFPLNCLEAIPTIYASVRKCPFFGIAVVSFLRDKLMEGENRS